MRTVEEIREYHRKHYLANRERRLAQAAQYRKENREGYEAAQRAYREANREKRRLLAEAWRAKNPGRLRPLLAQWRRDNAHKMRAFGAARYALKIRAIPKWANKERIEEIYALAAARTKETGIKWQIDHIVPLKSPRVCGLHVENNLRVIPQSDNLAKGNRYWPDMP